MLGQFEKAMTICLKEDRMADALIIANCGSAQLFEKAQSAYLSRKTQGPNYLRLLASVIGKNLWDIVYNADLSNWKETMASLCSYAGPDEFPDLCEALGDRIMETGSLKDASFCYLVGSKLEKVITIWITELNEAEKAGVETASGDSSFSVHARTLQNFIEKVTVFRDVTKFQDTEQSLTADWKLAPLYEKYTEYADIVAAHGHLAIAERYLDLLPTKYPAAEVARNRVKLASRKAAPAAKAAQPTSSVRTASRNQPAVGYQPVGAPTATPARPTPSAYAPPGNTGAQPPTANPYAPPTSNPYAPQGYQPQQQPQPTGYGGYAPPANNYMQPPPQSFGAPPPRNTTPSVAPPSRAKNMEQWNDTPMVTKATPARRTGSVPPVNSPFPNQQNLSMPPPAQPYGARATPTPPPPPPKGPPMQRVTSPLAGGPPQRPSSTANQYAPQSPATSFNQPMQPTVPRGPSPYNAPPSAPPPSNRYAPAPTSQYSQPPTPQGQGGPPPAGNRPPPPSNPYAPPPSASQNSHAPAQSPYETNTPPPSSFPGQGPPPPMSEGPPQGPPQGSRAGPPPRATPPAPAAPTKAKHPAGDRSHIPSSAQRMVEIFSNDMARVASKAPASFAPQVKDTQKRLNILFDHLNNEELIRPDTIARLSQLADALSSKDYDTAGRLQVDIQREKTEECGTWMVNLSSHCILYSSNILQVGVKRLVSMSKVTP